MSVYEAFMLVFAAMTFVIVLIRLVIAVVEIFMTRK